LLITTTGIDAVQNLIPANVVKYHDLPECVLDQQRNNEIGAIGRRPVGPLDQLRIVKFFYDNGKRENWVRGHLQKDTLVQKYFGICRINMGFPETDFYARFFLSPTDSAYIPIKKPKHGELISLARRKEIQDKKAKGLALTPKELKDGVPIEVKDINNAILGWKALIPGTNKKKVMEGDQIRGLAGQCPVDLVRLSYQSAAEDNVGLITDLYEEANKNALNKALELVKAKKGVVTLKALLLVQHGQQLVNKLADFLLDSKSQPVVANFATMEKGVDSVINPPLPGPMPTDISRIWMSRALQSL